MARRRSFSHGAKRNTDWAASPPLTAIATIPASSAVLLETGVPTGAGETVIRTRGWFGVFSDQAAADETYIGAVGIGVVSEQAATVGVTAIPHPGTDAAWDGWYYHQYFAGVFEFADATGFVAQAMQGFQVDSKAMRKVGAESRIVVVVEATRATGFNIAWMNRILTKPY